MFTVNKIRHKGVKICSKFVFKTSALMDACSFSEWEFDLFCNLLGFKFSMQHFGVKSLNSVIRISYKTKICSRSDRHLLEVFLAWKGMAPKVLLKVHLIGFYSASALYVRSVPAVNCEPCLKMKLWQSVANPCVQDHFSHGKVRLSIVREVPVLIPQL